MKLTNNKSCRGITLIEVTVVFLIVTSLIAIFAIGVRAWKDGNDRSNCVNNVDKIQRAANHYSTVKQVAPDSVDIDVLLEQGYFEGQKPTCPDGGKYVLVQKNDGSFSCHCSLDSHASSLDWK